MLPHMARSECVRVGPSGYVQSRRMVGLLTSIAAPDAGSRKAAAQARTTRYPRRDITGVARDAIPFSYARLGSKRNLASVLPSGIRVGYPRVKHARQNSLAGLV